MLLVSRVLAVRRAASMRAGGQGIRYTCRLTNCEDGEDFVLELFHEGDYWFIEREKRR